MSNKNKLGKGLGAIFGDDVSSVLEEIQSSDGKGYGIKGVLPVHDIRVNPYQPRRYFDEKALEELSDSIVTHGLFTPILVRETETGYELIAGERRLRASKLANLDTIEAIVVQFDDNQMMEIAIIENIQREDLNIIEEALGYKNLIERLKLTQDEVAKRVSKSRSHVTNTLRLLKLPESVQHMVNEKKLTMGHVRALLALEDAALIKEVALEIYAKQLSVRDTEKYIRDILNPPVDRPRKKMDSTYDYAASLFETKLQTRVEVDSKSVKIHFSDQDDLNRIMELLDVME